jgi:hypothetical protein
MSKNIHGDAYQPSESRDGMLTDTHTGVGLKPGWHRPVRSSTEEGRDETC